MKRVESVVRGIIVVEKFSDKHDDKKREEFVNTYLPIVLKRRMEDKSKESSLHPL